MLGRVVTYDAFEHRCEITFLDNSRPLVVMVTMYLDAAFKPKTRSADPSFHTLTGFAGTVDDWRKFRKDWKKSLEKKKVEYFRMAKFEYAKSRIAYGQPVPAKNPFAHFTSVYEFDLMFDHMANVIGRRKRSQHNNIGRYRLTSYGSSVFIDDYYACRPKELADDVRCVSPYVFNVYALIRAMANWADKTGQREDISYVFATGDDEIGQLHDLFLWLKKHPIIAKELRLQWPDNEVLKQAVMKTESAVQAADILAYETHALLTKWHELGRPEFIPHSETRSYLTVLGKNGFGGVVYSAERIQMEFAEMMKRVKWQL